MRLRLFYSIGPVAIGAASNVESNLTYFGTPRLYLDGVLPTLDIAEGYIRESQGIQAAGTEFETSCSADKPCLLGSCCNKDGEYQFNFQCTALIIFRPLRLPPGALRTRQLCRRLQRKSSVRRVLNVTLVHLPAERLLLLHWFLWLHRRVLP